jgi:broad specificity phosphatase PhoE
MDDRIGEFVQELQTNRGGSGSVLIVSHLGPIETMLRTFSGAPEAKIRNCSIVVIDTDERPGLSITEDVAHLNAIELSGPKEVSESGA